MIISCDGSNCFHINHDKFDLFKLKIKLIIKFNYNLFIYIYIYIYILTVIKFIY